MNFLVKDHGFASQDTNV